MSKTKRTPRQRTRRTRTLAARLAASIGSMANRVAPEEKSGTARMERSSWTKNWGNLLTDARKAKRFRDRMRRSWMYCGPRMSKFSRRSRRERKNYGCRKRRRR